MQNQLGEENKKKIQIEKEAKIHIDNAIQEKKSLEAILGTQNKILEEEKKALQDQNLWDIFLLESELTLMLLDMRFLGVRVDIEQAYDLAKTMLKEETKILDSLKINPWSSKNLISIFKEHKLPFKYTNSGNPSFPRTYLESLNHPVCKKIVKTIT